MSGIRTILATELPHKVTIRNRVADGLQDEYGTYTYTSTDVESPCRFEFQDVSKVSHRTKDQEFVAQHFLQLYMFPSAKVNKNDQIVQVKTKNGEVVFTDDNGANPLMIQEIVRIPLDDGIHHLEVYCDFRNPQI